MLRIFCAGLLLIAVLSLTGCGSCRNCCRPGPTIAGASPCCPTPCCP